MSKTEPHTLTIDELPSVENFIPEIDRPTACGYKVLVAVREAKTKTAGGIELPDVSIEAQDYLQICGKVVDMGVLCYTHPKFQGCEPFCKIGDDVLFHSNAGDGFWYDDVRYRFLNDDNILGLAPNPDKLRVYIK